uniref:Uncharacterized protein n=1 Tax=Strigamia maritima TaxID=126957 RepID=T1J7C9_STRMM
MKGMKQEEPDNTTQHQRFRDQVTFTVSCFDDDLAASKAASKAVEAGAGDEMQRQHGPTSNTVNTCVSIVIDPVEEEQIGHLDELNEQIKSLDHPTTPDSGSSSRCDADVRVRFALSFARVLVYRMRSEETFLFIDPESEDPFVNPEIKLQSILVR